MEITCTAGTPWSFPLSRIRLVGFYCLDIVRSYWDNPSVIVNNSINLFCLLQRNGKSSACNVVKVMDGNGTVRPERLLARLKINSVDENGPRLIVTRPPKGPDGSRGFAASHRLPRIAGRWR